MTNENEQPTNAWEDEDETETTSRNSSSRAADQRRSQPRAGNPSQNTSGRRSRPRGVPGSADFYEEIESDERATRLRPIRQSREEVEARLRQRSRQPIYSRDQEEPRTRPASQPRKQPPQSPQRAAEGAIYLSPDHQPRPTRDFPASSPARPTRPIPSSTPAQRPAEPYDRYDENDDYAIAEERGRLPDRYDENDDYEIVEERRHRRHREHEHPRKRRRGGRVFSTLLTGCLGGLLALIIVAAVLIFLAIHNTPLGQNLGVSKSTFNQPGQQTLDLGTATQLIVKDQTGNVVVNVDPNSSTASLNSVKHVQGTSQSDANNQFKQIVLTTKTIAQGADPACLASSCLLVSATTPATTGGLFGGTFGDAIDLTITLPNSFNSPNPSAPNIVTASANAGNINVNGFTGVLNLNGDAGNITVAHALIFAGTCIQTLHGNITVAQQSIFDLASASKLIPCSNAASSDPHRPWFNVKSGVGNVDITLITNLNNLLLDANTNNGTIADDFNLNITNSNGSGTYHGPLVPNTNPTASLYVATSTGNIMLHK